MTLVEKFNSISNFLYQNDTPKVFKNFLDNYSEYVTWSDVERIFNCHKLFVEIVRDKNKIDVPYGKYFWYPKMVQDKKFIFDSVNSGDTFVINQFCAYNEKINFLLKAIESTFDVVCDAHVYGSLKKESKSFYPHIDVPPNFICQIEGVTKWRLYKNRSSDLYSQGDINVNLQEDNLEIDFEVDLSPGDILYIPARCFHGAFPSEQRLSISIPCRHKKYNTTDTEMNLDRNYYNLNYKK